MDVKQIAKLLEKDSSSTATIRGFAVDSRRVEPGFLFFALRGEKVDGHSFLESAQKAGAIAAVVSKEYRGTVAGLELIAVEDVHKALRSLASFKVASSSMRCIAVTGSVGKTTTKEFIYELLSGWCKVYKTPGNANSQIGLPLSLLNLQEEPEVFVAEMGMSQKGEIAALVSLLPPEIAVVTKVALCHAAFFPGGLAEIAEAKAEILTSSRLKKAFLQVDTAAFAPFQNKGLFYGTTAGKARLVQKGAQFAILVEEEEIAEIALPFTASHLAENFLAAALVAKELGMAWEEIAQKAKTLTPYKGRFETVEKEGVLYINDAYNASPASMKAALENLPKPAPHGKVIAALGDMRELGSFSCQAHEEIGKVAASCVDELLCLGEETLALIEAFKGSGRKAKHFLDLALLKEELFQRARPGDVVLIKASNSLKMWSIL